MLTLLIGLPGSGKSTYAEASGDMVVSTDELRRFLTGRYDDLSRDRLVFDLAQRMVDYYLAEGRNVAFDATNVTRPRRAPFITLAKKHDRPVWAIVLEVSPEEAHIRNRQREKAVPPRVIRRLAVAYEEPSPEEGFDAIIWVRPSGDGL